MLHGNGAVMPAIAEYDLRQVSKVTILDLWLRMIENCDFANLAEVVLSYRRHDSAISIKYATQQILSAFCARVTAQRRLNGAVDPTSNVDLITPEVVRGLGVDQQTLNAEMLRGIREAAEMAINQARRSAAAEFLEIPEPFASPDSLRDIATKLNYKAAQSPASAEKQLRHRRVLLA